MRIFCLVALYILPFFSPAQYSSIALTEKNAKKLGELSKHAVLYLVINNEKEASEAALVTAVKNYWKTGSYKFMSKAEFINLKLKDELSPDNLYLYEWFGDASAQSINMEASQAAIALSKIKTGYYFLASGYKSESSDKNKSRIISTTPYLFLKFDLSSTLVNNKSKILDAYFDLMIKYFNNEITFCQNLVSVKDVKKQDKDGMVYFGDGLNDIQTKDILLIKEQVNKKQPSNKKNENKDEQITAVSQFNPPLKNVYTVYPEDIKMALSKNDKQVLLYSNDMLISASNGAVVAASGKYGIIPQKKDYGFWLAAIGILVSAFVTASVMK